MSYESKTWIDDEVIERAEMQNIEDGINTAHDNIDSHVIDATKHLTSAQNDGLDGANAPGSSNVFATILDIALTIDDTAYNESTWNGDTDAASKNAIRDKIVAMDSDTTLNTTHRTSNGSDHTFIDQDVTNSSSPTFIGTNITTIPATNIIFNVLGTPTYETAQDWFNVIQTSGIISGFELSNSRSATELDVAAGTGIVKTTDSEIGSSVSFDFAGIQNVTLTADNINYIYLDYNVGTPQIVATTNRASIELNRHFTIGRVYKNGSTLHVLNGGVHLPNLARNEHERLVERDGFTYASGAITSETGTLNLAITAGVWFLGHNRLTTNALNSSVADTWIYTHYGAASWITDNATATAVDTTHYNDGTDVLASLGSNNYGVQWVYITTDSHWYIIYDTVNGTLSAAQAATPPTSLPSYLEHMGELTAKIIHKQDGTIVSIEIAQDVAFTSAGIPNHNDTGGIQGGIANEYYHLTSAEKTEFDDIDSTYAVLGANSDITSLSGLTTDLSIAQGGTGQSTAQAAIDALSAVSGATNEYVLTKDTSSGNALWKVTSGFDDPMTTRGDIIIRNASNVTDRLAIGSDTHILTSDGTDISWALPSITGIKSLLQLTPNGAFLPVTNPAFYNAASGATTKAGWDYLAFDDTTQECAIWRIRMADYDAGNIVIKSSIKLTAPPETSKTVIFDLYTIGVASGENFENAVPTDTTVSITHTITRTELMPNQVDRDFSGASAWVNVDIDAYDETDDLTITADTADQYCTCPVASMPTTVGKRYTLEFDVANIASTWTIKSYDGTQTIGTVIANGSDKTISFIAETTGGLRIVADSTTSSGDFDNFSLYSADLVHEASATIDPANVAVDELMVLELKRDVATDTLVGDAQLIELDIEFTRN